MEINYNTIINVLCPIESISNTSNSFLDCVSKKINDLLESDNYNISTLNYDGNLDKRFKNASFFASILSSIDDNFLQTDNSEKLEYIHNFILHTKNKLLEKKFSYELKFKFTKNVLLERVNNLELDDGLIYQLIVQILNINVLIFEDVSNEIEISTLFYGDNMDPWKPTVLLFKKENKFSLISSKDKKIFSYNDNEIKNLLMNNYSSINYFNSEYLDKMFCITDNIQEIINEFLKNNNIENEILDEPNENKNINQLDSDSSNDELIKENSGESSKIFMKEQKIYNKSNLKSMKKDEIISLYKIYDKITDIDKLKKDIIIDKFLSIQNNNSINSC